jgi:putative methyltransferase (TIGR04325 family)
VENKGNHWDLVKLGHLLRQIIPGVVFRSVTGLFYGWRGNFSSWQKAQRKCTGYDSEIILAKVKLATSKVRDGIVPYEKDSVVFDRIHYSFPLLSGLMWIAARNGGRMNVLDFGGSLGSTYFQNKKFLDSLVEVNWCIVEQPHFVRTGSNNFSDARLHFYYTIDEALQVYPADVVILSSVIQYLEFPYALLDDIFSKNVRFIIIDQTRFFKTKGDRITIQKVPWWIYKAKYPCWFFNLERFKQHFASSYNLLYEFDIAESINIKSLCKGFFFEKKTTKINQ